MRYLQRLGKPQKLTDNEVKWTNSFIASGKDRPSSAQYGHKEIKEHLANISFQKCFYSEVKFAQVTEAQVDHYIEVAEDPSKAFEWDNLYLSCKDSNIGKPNNINLPNADCLDPFTNNDTEIEQHLDFEDEMIFGLTEKGRNTILKYRLNKPIYDTLRSRELRNFNNIVKAAYFSGKTLDDDTKEILKRFANPDKPFSLMFKKILIKHNLI